MTTITIPVTQKAMITELTGAHELLTATQWKKAAILAAFVELTGKGGDRKSDQRGKSPSDRMTCNEFAALRIAGCKDPKVIRTYVRRWIATTRPIPKPGDEVNLDGLPDWETETADAITRAVDENPEAVARALVKSNRGPSAIKKARKEDREESKRAYEQEVLEGGIHTHEMDAMDDHWEAVQHLVKPLRDASNAFGLVQGDWPTYRQRLTRGDIEHAQAAIRDIDERLAVIRMLATDDIVGEVLRHDHQA